MKQWGVELERTRDKHKTVKDKEVKLYSFEASDDLSVFSSFSELSTGPI